MTQVEIKLEKFRKLYLMELEVIKRAYFDKDLLDEYVKEMKKIVAEKFPLNEEIEFYQFISNSVVNIYDDFLDYDKDKCDKKINNKELSENEKILKDIVKWENIDSGHLLGLYASDSLLHNEKALESIIKAGSDNYRIVNYKKNYKLDYFKAFIDAITIEKNANFELVPIYISELPRDISNQIDVPLYFFEKVKETNYENISMKDTVDYLFENYKEQDTVCGFDGNIPVEIVNEWLSNPGFLEGINSKNKELLPLIKDHLNNEKIR